MVEKYQYNTKSNFLSNCERRNIGLLFHNKYTYMSIQKNTKMENEYNAFRRIYAFIGFYIAPVLVLIIIAQHYAIINL